MFIFPSLPGTILRLVTKNILQIQEKEVYMFATSLIGGIFSRALCTSSPLLGSVSRWQDSAHTRDSKELMIYQHIWCQYSIAGERK